MFPYEAEVLENRYLIPGIRFIRLRYPEGFTYEAGQFVSLGIPLDDGKILRRSYSIASAPHNDCCLTLAIKEIVGGQFTSRLKDYPEGSKFLSTPAMGTFDFPQEAEVVFIAAGIGITPIRGLLEYAYEQRRSNHMMLLYGIKDMNDFLFKEDFYTYARELHLDILPVVSRDDSYEGLKGHAQDYISQEIIPHLAHRNTARFFICGMKALATECKEHLLASGINKTQIHIEAFD